MWNTSSSNSGPLKATITGDIPGVIVNNMHLNRDFKT